MDNSAYKLFVAIYKFGTFLDEKLWPPGISFRRFLTFRRHEKIEASVK